MNSQRRWNRRQMLLNTAKGLGALTALAAAKRGGGILSARADDTQRAGIFFSLQGSYDSLWWQNGVLSSEFSTITRLDRGGLVTNDSGNLRFVNPTDILRNFDNIPPDLVNKTFWDFRCPDFDPANPTTQYMREHPTVAGQFVGPGMSIYSDQELSKMAIWRGIKNVSGGHNIGNRGQFTGTTGNTTPSFSAVIAQRLAQDFVRPLHYVQLGESGQMLNQSAYLTGPSEPIQIPGMSAWNALTSSSLDDLPADRRVFIDRAIASLAGEVVRSEFRLSRSKSMMSSFLQSYQSSVSLEGSGYAGSAEFNSLWASYRSAITAAYGSHFFATWFPRSNVFFNANIESPNDGISSQLNLLAFQFALAEFLVTHRLSAVVDVPLPLRLDYHQDIGADCATLLAFHACFRTLMNHLSAKSLGDGSGQNFLDKTTLGIFSEFDRESRLSGASSMLNLAGSEHFDSSASCILAGAGIKNGLFGNFMRGPTGMFSGPTWSRFDRYMPLPVNLNTGEADINGKIPDTWMIFPTLLSAFDAGSLNPLNGAGSAFRAILK